MDRIPTAEALKSRNIDINLVGCVLWQCGGNFGPYFHRLCGGSRIVELGE
ncbi:hypothetical protein HanIR_Chr04g0167631 [Helianthus annuus]|nr:hypothetical protein HanIR_Chr04g0167631 [Helianthus annuus]